MIVNILHVVINLKLKRQKWEAVSVYLGSKNCSLESTDSKTNQNSVLATGWGQGVFMKKGKELITWIDFYWCANELSCSLAAQGWLLTLSSDKESIILSPCGQNVCFPADFTNSCSADTLGLAQCKGSRSQVDEAASLEWLLHWDQLSRPNAENSVSVVNCVYMCLWCKH